MPKRRKTIALYSIPKTKIEPPRKEVRLVGTHGSSPGAILTLLCNIPPNQPILADRQLTSLLNYLHGNGWIVHEENI